MTTEERIKTEEERIAALFEKAANNEKAIIAPLVQNAAFMKVTLEDLQAEINATGTTDAYQNGENQRGIKQSAQLQGYNALVKNYTAVIKALEKLLPYEPKQPSALQQWMQRNEKTEEEKELERKEREAQADYWSEQAKLLMMEREERDRAKAAQSSEDSVD